MPAIDQVVRVNISAETTAVSTQSFSIPLIVGPTDADWEEADRVHTYTSAAAMLTDGFTSSSPEFICAASLYAQDNVPPVIKVARRSGAATAQVDTIAVATLTDGHVYKFSINGTQVSYTADEDDTQQDILSALRPLVLAVAPVTATVTGTGVNAVLTITGSTPGLPTSFSNVDSSLTAASVTPASGIANDLALAQAQDNTWYGVVVAEATDDEIMQTAMWVESARKFFVATSSSSDIGQPGSSDIASQLKSSSFDRTALLFAVAGANKAPDAAWISQLALVPGSATWAFKTLRGVPADTLTDSQVANIIGVPLAGVAGKNANVYTTIGGVSITQQGQAASGQFIDITVGLDWLVSTMQANVFAALANSRKIPYTDNGTAVLMSQVRTAIDQGIDNGLIDGASPITVRADKIDDVPQNQRAQRRAPTIYFTVRLAGAEQSVDISGTVTV